MRTILRIGVSLSLLTAAFTPCSAQEIGAGQVERSTGMFAGIHLRLSGSDQGVQPQVRLGTNVFSRDSGVRTANWRLGPSWLELGLSRSGHAELSVQGTRVEKVQQRLGMSGQSGIAVGLGVLAAGAAMLALAADDDDDRDLVCLGIGVCPPVN